MPEQEKEQNPNFKFKSLPIGGSIKMKLETSKPIATGTNNYGEWNLWLGHVKNAKVTHKDGKEEADYTGKVTFFPSTKLHEALIAAANGKDEVEVEVTRLVEDGKRGLMTKYPVVKLSEGIMPSSSSLSLSNTEMNLVNDAKALISQGIKISEADFVSAASEEQYKGLVSENRAKDLYRFL